MSPADKPPPTRPDAPWTSRRRLLAAMRCQQPDRVPINTYELAGYDSRDWYHLQPSYARLLERIRRDTDCITNWNPAIVWSPAKETMYAGTAYLDQRLGETAYPVAVKHHVDRKASGTRATEIVNTPKGELRRVLEWNDQFNTTWQIEHWCKSKDDVDKALSIPYQPMHYDASDLVRVRRELGDHGLVMTSLSDPAYIAADLMNMADFTLWAFEDTEHFSNAVQVMAERVMENLRRQLEACVVDVYRICGPEYFTPPFLSPDMFERFVVPHVSQMVDIIHAHGALVRLHCHGHIAQVLDMIIATGCDGIDPCEEPPCGDITIDQVKQRCAQAGVSVWGTMQLQTLEYGSEEQVRQQVRHCMDHAKAGGGYVFLPCASPINAILPPKTEHHYNVMIDTALELGVY